MRTTVGYWCGIAVLLTWVSFASLPQADARTLTHAASGCFNNSCYRNVLDDLRWAAEVVETVQPAPGQTSRDWRSGRASLLEGIDFDWRPLFVLGVGEILGHIVRGVTGFGSAIVLVSFWTICKTFGLDAGPFQSLIFADSICSLATAAPLVYITKPWKFASWRLVVTLLAFQAMGAPVGAFLVLRLEPARLNFAIATALLVLFLLMVCPVAEGIRQLRMWARPRPKHAPDLRQPLLSASSGAGAKVPGKWWPQWLQRKGRSQQAGYSALPAGIPSGEASALEGTSAKPSVPSRSPFSDASQQQRQLIFADPTDGYKAEPSVSTTEVRFADNPLLLSRKQSDSASSLRGPGGGSPTLPIKHISICEEPEQATACSRVGSVGGPIIEGNGGGAWNDAAVAGSGPPGASFGGQDEGLGGPGEGAAGGAMGGEERASNSGLHGRELGGPSGTAAGGPADGGGSVSGDSDLAQTASTELGGIVIGVGPDPETPRTQSMATRTASQAAAEWTMDSWTLVPSAAVAATCAGMLSALSGIGGPPLILMFELLEVPKRVVRATMTTTSIVSVKFFTYLFMGSAQFSDVPLYCVAIISAYIGLNIGNAAAKRMNQQAFSKVLLAVMLLSTCLLYASSFGLTEH